MARKSIAGRMFSASMLEGHCNEHGGLYFPPGTGGAYACLLPDGTLIVCGGDWPYYCVESRTLDDKGLGLSEAQTENITIQSADHEKSRIRAQAELDLAEVDVDLLTANEESDLSAIEDAVAKAEAARTSTRLESIKARRAVLEALTPEQREEWENRIDARIRQKGRQKGADSPRSSGEQRGR